MKNIFDAAFWKFLAGFAAMLAVSLGFIVAVGFYEMEIKGEPQAAHAAP